jgi:hypothetical protein
MAKKSPQDEKPLSEKPITQYLEENIYSLIGDAKAYCRLMMDEFKDIPCNTSIIERIDKDGVITTIDVLDQVIHLRDIIMKIDLSLTGYIRERMKSKHTPMSYEPSLLLVPTAYVSVPSETAFYSPPISSSSMKDSKNAKLDTRIKRNPN